MNNDESILTSFHCMQEVVAFRPAFARALGSPLAALFLSQSIYWQSIAGKDKWWFKLRDAKRDKDGNIIPPSNRAQQSWEWELGMTRSQQEISRKILLEKKLIKCKRYGIPARLHFMVDMDRLMEFIKHIESNSTESKGQTDGNLKPTSTNSSIPSLKSSRNKKANAKPDDPVNFIAAANNKKLKSLSYSPAGIVCWLDSDREIAANLENRYGLEKVKEVVNKLLSNNIEPYPSRVSKGIKECILAKDRESLRAKAAEMALKSQEEESQRERGKQLSQALTSEERADYVEKYLSNEGARFSQTYDPNTGKFSDAIASAKFRGWLIARLRNDDEGTQS